MGKRADTVAGMARTRECFCPDAILRCAHVDGDAA